ncbi:putative Piwi domain, ribonuclease H-like superfamily [Helianthus annuus]|nr:putative Piwi domain, ribonuclease H-like superfamily [Helianthus annuus]KAJ0843894.1 putative Piwi domain, ribonuclease H-like superfamily [Helianthus annuus]
MPLPMSSKQDSPTNNHADDLHELVHNLSIVYQRSTTAISVVAPICYAHLAATQVGQLMKFEDRSELALAMVEQD